MSARLRKGNGVVGVAAPKPFCRLQRKQGNGRVISLQVWLAVVKRNQSPLWRRRSSQQSIPKCHSRECITLFRKNNNGGRLEQIRHSPNQRVKAVGAFFVALAGEG